jgi:GntR family transcriptional regulator
VELAKPAGLDYLDAGSRFSMNLALKRRGRNEDRDDVRRHLRSSSQPLYVSLSQLLRQQIVDGHWPAASQLPTIAEMSSRYGVARVTVRQALGELAAEGLIESLQGKGTYVSGKIQKPKSVQLESSWQNFLQQIDGNVPQALHVEETAELPVLVAGEGLSAGSYRYMQRVHRSRGQPYCVIDLYLANDYYALAPEAFDSQMVIPLLGRLAGNDLKKMTQSFRIMAADLFVARVLDLPLHAPIGEVRRVITNQRDQIVYLGVAKYRGDTVVFNTTIEVPR